MEGGGREVGVIEPCGMVRATTIMVSNFQTRLDGD
jgi:hypothetical protein